MDHDMCSWNDSSDTAFSELELRIGNFGDSFVHVGKFSSSRGFPHRSLNEQVELDDFFSVLFVDCAMAGDFGLSLTIRMVVAS